MVIAARLEKEVTRLAACHRNCPGQQRSPSRIDEQQCIRGYKTQGTEKVQTLVDAAMVVIPVVIPALGFQLFEYCGQKNHKKFSGSNRQCAVKSIESSI